MLIDVGTIKAEVLVRLGASSTSAYYSDTILNGWTNDSHRFCAGYKKWPMTEGKVSTTYVTSVTDEMGSVVVDYPEGWKQDSIRLLQVGGKRFTKVDFNEFQAFREDNPLNQKNVCADWGRQIYLNPNSQVSGSLVTWGQFTPAELDTSVPTTPTIFTNADIEGNMAMVEEMLSYAYQRERLEEQAMLHHNKAVDILNQVWQKYADEQFSYLSPPGNEGMFKRVDILGGDYWSDEIKRDQFY